VDRWFDAHLDLAYLAVCGRDLRAPVDRCGGPHLPAAICFPTLAASGVRACLATIFCEPGDHSPTAATYPPGDAEAAHAAGLRQIEQYRAWSEDGTLPLGLARAREVPLRAGILMEGADPIRTPEELPWWKDRGVLAVGLAWVKASRYAGGNSTDLGLTPPGRALVRGIDALDLVHDVSHLCDRSLEELLALTPRPVMASHSNCRALLDGRNQRHLTDAAIREIARRGGVVGLNLFSRFLRPGLDEAGRAGIDDCLRHVEHVCDLVGHRRAVGLGSDMDGGFSAARLPQGIDRPVHLERLAEALAARGWDAQDIAGFRWGNWARFFGLVVAE